MTTTIKGSASGASEIAGDLGIGGTPVTGLAGSKTAHIKGTSSGAYLRLTTDTAGHTAGDGLDIILGGGVNPDAYIWNRESGPLKFGTNNTEQMQIDVAGIVTTPNQPVISGQIGTAMTHPVSPTLIAFNQFWSNVGISYNATSKRFTVPAAGKYRITLNPFFTTDAAASRVLIGVNNDAPNSSTHYGHTYRESSTYDTGCLNSVVTLAANDYIVFYLSQGALYNKSSDRFTQFSIEKIA